MSLLNEPARLTIFNLTKEFELHDTLLKLKNCCTINFNFFPKIRLRVLLPLKLFKAICTSFYFSGPSILFIHTSCNLDNDGDTFRSLPTWWLFKPGTLCCLFRILKHFSQEKLLNLCTNVGTVGIR